MPTLYLGIKLWNNRVLAGSVSLELDVIFLQQSVVLLGVPAFFQRALGVHISLVSTVVLLQPGHPVSTLCHPLPGYDHTVGHTAIPVQLTHFDVITGTGSYILLSYAAPLYIIQTVDKSYTVLTVPSTLFQAHSTKLERTFTPNKAHQGALRRLHADT